MKNNYIFKTISENNDIVLHFSESFHAWHNKGQLDSQICPGVPSVAISCHVTPGKRHPIPVREWMKKANDIFVLLR